MVGKQERAEGSEGSVCSERPGLCPALGPSMTPGVLHQHQTHEVEPQ